jgi:hypothetical protein
MTSGKLQRMKMKKSPNASILRKNSIFCLKKPEENSIIREIVIREVTHQREGVRGGQVAASTLGNKNRACHLFNNSRCLQIIKIR